MSKRRPETIPNPVTKVAICIVTFRRPEGLGRLLDGLGRLTFGERKPELEIIVVDNDATGATRDTCDKMQYGLAWPIRYHIEPRQGISYARNAAINQVRPDTEWVAFIDDDEVPAPTWLDELLRVGTDYAADVVAAPVLPRFVEPPPDWVVVGGFFDGPRRPTGTAMSRAFSGNALFRNRIFNQDRYRFDERFALTGGEDAHLSARLHRKGYKFVWADDAVVHEWTPPHRVRARWILRRAFRIGSVSSLVDRDVRTILTAFCMNAAIGCYRILKGLLLLPVLGPFGIHLAVRYLRHISYGAGMLAGLTGFGYEEYRTPDK